MECVEKSRTKTKYVCTSQLNNLSPFKLRCFGGNISSEWLTNWIFFKEEEKKKKEEGVKERRATHEWCPVTEGKEEKEQLLVPMIIFACDIFVSL